MLMTATTTKFVVTLDLLRLLPFPSALRSFLCFILPFELGIRDCLSATAKTEG